MRDTFQKAWREARQGKSGSAADATGNTGRQGDILKMAGFLEGHTKSSTKPVESHERKGRSPRQVNTPKAKKSDKKGGKRREPVYDEDDEDFASPAPSSGRKRVGYCLCSGMFSHF